MHSKTSRKSSAATYETMTESSRRASVATITKGLPNYENEDRTGVLPTKKNIILFAIFGTIAIGIAVLFLCLGHKQIWSYVAAGILAITGGCCYIRSTLLWSESCRERVPDVEAGPQSLPECTYIDEKRQPSVLTFAVADIITKPEPVRHA